MEGFRSAHVTQLAQNLSRPASGRSVSLLGDQLQGAYRLCAATMR